MAAYTDRTLQCVQCDADFTFSAEDQEYHERMGFQNEPKRCKPCRAARKQNASGRGDDSRSPREFHQTVCAECGQTANVPFKPRGDRPVYCSECFGNRR